MYITGLYIYKVGDTQIKKECISRVCISTRWVIPKLEGMYITGLYIYKVGDTQIKKECISRVCISTRWVIPKLRRNVYHGFVYLLGG